MKKVLLLSFILFFFSVSNLSAFILRDSETENFIKELITPIAKAANQNTKNLKIIIIQNKDVNAFVTPGQRIFLFSGLLLNVKNPNELQGVLAHELGHITGRHHLTIYNELAKARIINNVGLFLGGAATLLSGDPAAAAAIAGGAQTTAQRSFLNFSRVQEGAADQAGFSYLRNSNKSICGIVNFLEFLESREVGGLENPYLRSHPLTSKRIFDAKKAASNEDCSKSIELTDEINKFKFIQAKLNGFINPQNTIQTINNNESFTEDHKTYGLAIANYKISNVKRGNSLINKLIKKYPKNPYFYELKAQMLRENGIIEESLKYYTKVNELLPNDGLLLIEIAHTKINLDNEKYLKSAIINLKKASITEEENQKLWYLLSIAYGRSDLMGKSRYASAYSAYLKGDDKLALSFIERAKKITKRNSIDWNKIEDLESKIKRK